MKKSVCRMAGGLLAGISGSLLFFTWSRLNHVEQSAGACGNEIEMEMEFDSKMVANHSEGDVQITSRVEAVIPLSLSEESETYQGTATLEHTDYSNTLSELGCTFDLEDGSIGVEVKFTEAGVQYSPDIEGYITILNKDVPSVVTTCPEGIHFDLQTSIWWPTFVIMHEEKGVSETGFLFTNWEKVEDPWRTASLSFNRSEPSPGGPELTFTEETSIELRHAQ